MTDTKALEEFFGDLVAVLRKHECRYFEAQNVWFDSSRYEVRYDADPEFEVIEYRLVSERVEINCVERWK